MGTINMLYVVIHTLGSTRKIKTHVLNIGHMDKKYDMASSLPDKITSSIKYNIPAILLKLIAILVKKNMQLSYEQVLVKLTINLLRNRKYMA